MFVSSVSRTSSSSAFSRFVDTIKSWPSPLHFYSQLDKQEKIAQRIQQLWLEEKQKQIDFDHQNTHLYRDKASWLFDQARLQIFGHKKQNISTEKEASDILEEMNQYHVRAGQSIKPFEILNSIWPEETQTKQERLALSMLRFRWGDPQMPAKRLKDFIKIQDVINGTESANPLAVQAYQEVFKGLLITLKTNPNIDPTIATATINNMLAFLAFSTPENGDIFTIPTHRNGQWKAADYITERIQISPKEYPLTPYYAYGLMPIHSKSNDGAKILFMGTTLTGATGGFFTLISDTKPLASVGAWSFNHGQKNIEAFLQKAFHQTGCKTEAVGQSLGGCMAILSAIELGSYIEKAHAFSPAALASTDLKKWENQALINQTSPEIEIYLQDLDLVPIIGSGWAKKWKVNHVHSYKMKNPYEGHMRAGTAADNVVLAQRKGTVSFSLKRVLFNTLHFIIGGLFFFNALCVVEGLKLKNKSFPSKNVKPLKLKTNYQRVYP